MVLVLVGALLVLLAMTDAVFTTLAAGRGGGPLTQHVGRWTWRLLRAASRHENSRLLAHAGMCVLLSTVLTWVLLTWVGWTLVYASSDGAVLDSTTSAPADLAARIYFAGFVIFTLGVGDVVPGAGAWQVVTALASFLGLFLVTLSITYLVSVVSAAVDRRALARDISLSGETGSEVVLLHWAGDAISSTFTSLTQTLSTQVLRISQQHLAYPVLHHFHATEAASSAPRALAVLDDTLLILEAGVPEHVRPAPDVLTRLRRTLEQYAETVTGAASADAPLPPLPDLGLLRGAGIPTVGDAQFALDAELHETRRRRVHELVRADAWPWPAAGPR